MAHLLKSTLVYAGKVFGAAFRTAYNNVAHGGMASSAVAGVQKRLPLDEARQILDVPADVKPDEMYEKYKKLYEANAVEKGGSFYLQSKIYRAKESFENEWAAKSGRLGGAGKKVNQ